MYGDRQTLEVDFNDIDDDRQLTIYRPFVFRGALGLARGAEVALWDSESGSCLAEVRRVRGKRIDLSVLWDTWQPAASVCLVPEDRGTNITLPWATPTGRIMGTPEVSF